MYYGEPIQSVYLRGNRDFVGSAVLSDGSVERFIELSNVSKTSQCRCL